MSDYMTLETQIAELGLNARISNELYLDPIVQPIKAGGMPLIVPRGYGCCVFVGTLSVMLMAWKRYKVSAARRKYNVPDPFTYSDKSMEFNCIYRALTSSLEVYPQFMFMMMIGGLDYPYFSALGGLIFVFGRYIYAREYYTKEQPLLRRSGSFYWFGSLILFYTCFRFGFTRLSVPVFDYYDALSVRTNLPHLYVK